MPRRNRSKKMRGGLFGFFEEKEKGPNSQESAGWFDSLTKSANSATGSASNWFSSNTPPTATPPPVNNSYQPPAYGGKRRRHKSRRMRGGYSDNVSMTNLASRAAPFSGATARPQAYVGGRRTKRRCHTHKRSHKRHCRK